MRRPLLAAALLAAACAPTHPAAAPSPSDPALAAARKTPSHARDIACDLSDRVGPRLSGSEGYARAVVWALDEMKRQGLSNVHPEPVMVPHWSRGAASATLLGEGVEEPLAVTALGGSIATPAKGLEGEILRVESIEALAAMPADAAKGKIVFFDKPMTRGRNGFESYGNAVDVRAKGAAEAAKHGAIASVIRSIGTGESRFPHTGLMRYDDAVAKIPAAALAVPDAELLDRLLANGKPLRLRLTLETKDEPDVASSNVVGEVKGTANPDEVVVIGAHLDAWDLGRGAIDDAAGVGVVLDVAHALLASPRKRTVRVVLFANEENGIMGAKAYAHAHEGELAKHQAVVEIDAGDGRVFGLEWRAGASAKAFFESLGAELAPLGVGAPSFSDDAGGADTIPDRMLGVPSLELVQDGTRYFDYHHTADDTCDKIDGASLAQVRDATLITAWRLADAPALLERAPIATPTPAPTPAAAPAATPSARPGR